MREIEFRSKDEYGNWIYGLLTGNQYNLNEYAIFTQPYHEIYPIEKETIGQYTGLRDKNGVKIFEGDIVKIGKILWKVEWFEDFCEFRLINVSNESNKSFLNYYMCKYDLEVIGNIYDNPELLEREK